jgi:hypothetical protein
MTDREPASDGYESPVRANLCAEFCQAKNQTPISKPVTSTFCALGGIRTPNLLIRSRVPPSQWVAPVPAGYSNKY